MRANSRQPIVIESSSTEMAESRQDNKLYRNQSEGTSGKIADLIAEKMVMLDAINKRGKTNLKNLDEVQTVAFAYLESCRRSDTLPSFEGLSFALGFSRQNVYAYLKSHTADDPVVCFLEQLRTLFADIMTTASLKRYVDCATTIFSLKNMTGLGYSDRGDAIPESVSAEYDENNGKDYYLKKYGNLIIITPVLWYLHGKIIFCVFCVSVFSVLSVSGSGV